MLKKLTILKEYMCSFWNTLTFCLKLSWKSSKFYTLMRVLIQLFQVGVGTVTAFLGKYIINILSGGTQSLGQMNILIALLSLSFVIGILNIVFNKIREYCVGIHNESLMQHLNIEMIKKAVDADLELFDSPVFYNDFETAKRSMYSVTSVVWKRSVEFH